MGYGKQNTARITPRGVPQPLGGIDSSGKNLKICPYGKTRIALDTIFTNLTIDFYGSTVWAQYASSSTARALIAFEQPTNAQLVLYAPMHLTGFPFTRLYISNATVQAGDYIDLFYSLDLNPGIVMNLEGG